MKIYKITQGSKGRGRYDEYHGHVIVANNEKQVRAMAINTCASEGELVWEDAPIDVIGNYTGIKAVPFILLSDFNAG